MKIALSLVLGLISFSAAQAQLLDFNFSFTSGTGGPGNSTADGTVTGEIIGLQNDATSAPTDIIITSAPSGLHLPNLSYNLAANGWTLDGSGDTITVTNGVITAANYQAASGEGGWFDLNYSVMEGDTLIGQLNGLEYGGEYNTSNWSGFSGATYTPDTVPEPSTWTLLLAGMGVISLRFLNRAARR